MVETEQEHDDQTRKEKRILRAVALTTVVTAAVLLTAGTAAAQTNINSCQTISSSGDFVVNADLDGNGSDCIVVSASDVTIENDGHVITNSTNDGAAGVNISSGVSNIDLVDLVIEDSNHSIRADISQGEVTRDVRIDNLTADTQGASNAAQSVFIDPVTNGSINGFDLLDSDIRTPGTDGFDIDGDEEDGRIIDVRVSNNEFRVGSDDGILIESDSSERTTVRNIRITDNLVNATSGDAIELDGDANSSGGVNVVEDILIAGNTIEGDSGGPTDGIDFDYDSFDFTGPVRNLTVRDNVIDPTDDAGIEFDAEEDNFVGEDITFRNNTIRNADNEAVEIDLDDPDIDVDIDFVQNKIDSSEDDAVDIDSDSSGQTLNLRIIGNEITDTDTDSILFNDLQMHGADDVQVVIRDNLIDDGGLGTDGVDLDTEGTGGPDGELLIVDNEIRTGSEAIDKNGGPVTGIEIHRNTLVGDSFGVRNSNTTPGTFIDATNNFWGASEGPGSPVDADAPFSDPVTGTLADGNGSNVTEGGTAGVSNVHFDPFATSPVFGDGQECVNRRSLSRGQEGQECPTDRGLSRGESRRELDRRTGRDSDTARRDRSRRDRGRSR